MDHVCAADCRSYHVGIVGSASLIGEQALFARHFTYMIVSAYTRDLVAPLRPDAPFSDEIVIVSGKSPKGGVDIYAAEAGHHFGLPVLEFPPKNNRWKPEGYEERNILIAQRSDVLYRVARRDSTTYGSGYTYDLAKKLGKPVYQMYV